MATTIAYSVSTSSGRAEALLVIDLTEAHFTRFEARFPPPETLRHDLSERGIKAHLGSFIITPRPNPSLNHNLKSGTEALTGNKQSVHTVFRGSGLAE